MQQKGYIETKLFNRDTKWPNKSFVNNVLIEIPGKTSLTLKVPGGLDFFLSDWGQICPPLCKILGAPLKWKFVGIYFIGLKGS